MTKSMDQNSPSIIGQIDSGRNASNCAIGLLRIGWVQRRA
jgi:hypothetical protein